MIIRDMTAQQIGRPCLQGVTGCLAGGFQGNPDHPEREITLVCGDAVPTFQNKKGQFRLIRAAKIRDVADAIPGVT